MIIHFWMMNIIKYLSLGNIGFKIQNYPTIMEIVMIDDAIWNDVFRKIPKK